MDEFVTLSIPGQVTTGGGPTFTPLVTECNTVLGSESITSMIELSVAAVAVAVVYRFQENGLRQNFTDSTRVTQTDDTHTHTHTLTYVRARVHSTNSLQLSSSNVPQISSAHPKHYL